jgi:hypothetical protein
MKASLHMPKLRIVRSERERAVSKINLPSFLRSRSRLFQDTETFRKFTCTTHGCQVEEKSSLRKRLEESQFTHLALSNCNLGEAFERKF